MTTPDINKFQRTGDPQADLARWEAMGGTKKQLQAAFGDPEKPNSTFTAGQEFQPMPPNGNIWGGQMPMMGMMPQMGMPMIGAGMPMMMSQMGMPEFMPQIYPYVNLSSTSENLTKASTSSTNTINTSTSVPTSANSLLNNSGLAKYADVSSLENENFKYGSNFGGTLVVPKNIAELTTKLEIKSLKKQYQAYQKEFETYVADYKHTHKKELKTELKSYNDYADKKEKKAAKKDAERDFETKAYEYAKAKFRENHFDLENIDDLCDAYGQYQYYYIGTNDITHEKFARSKKLYR